MFGRWVRKDGWRMKVCWHQCFLVIWQDNHGEAMFFNLQECGGEVTFYMFKLRLYIRTYVLTYWHMCSDIYIYIVFIISYIYICVCVNVSTHALPHTLDWMCRHAWAHVPLDTNFQNTHACSHACHACMHPHIHTDIQTYKHTYRQTHRQTYRHSDIQTCMHACMHT